MAKSYPFRFTARQAIQEHGGRSVVYGGRDTIYHESSGEMTLKEAESRLAEISTAELRLHYASFIVEPGARKPAGYSTAQSSIYGGGH